MDLITQCALEMETAKGYLPEHIVSEYLDTFLNRLQDISLVDFVTRGVGFFHSGMTRQDQRVILEMYAEGIIRVLIVPRDACWSVPVRAATVVVMGTQYYHTTPGEEERQLRDYALEELVYMQGRAVRDVGAGGQFHLFCQAEGKDTFTRFLQDGLPLESKLLEAEALVDWRRNLSQGGAIRNQQDMVDALTFTFLARRLESNPIYYNASPGPKSEVLSRVVDSLDSQAES